MTLEEIPTLAQIYVYLSQLEMLDYTSQADSLAMTTLRG